MSKQPSDTIDNNPDFMKLESNDSAELGQVICYQNKHTGDVIFKKTVDTKSLLNTPREERIINHILDLQPREFSPIAPNYRMHYSLPLLKVNENPSELFFIDSSVTLECVIKSFQSQGVRFSDQDLYAILGFLLATGLVMEENLGFHTKISPSSILIMPHNRLSLRHPMMYQACVESLVVDIVHPISRFGGDWKDDWFRDQEKREMYMELESSGALDMTDMHSQKQKLMTILLENQRKLLTISIDTMFQTLLAVAALVEIDTFSTVSGELVEEDVNKAIQQVRKYYDREIADLLTHVLQKQAYDSFKTLDEEISRHPSLKHKIIANLNSNPVTAKMIPSSGFQNSILLNTVRDLHKITRQVSAGHNNESRAADTQSFQLNSLSSSALQDSNKNTIETEVQIQKVQSSSQDQRLPEYKKSSTHEEMKNNQFSDSSESVDDQTSNLARQPWNTAPGQYPGQRFPHQHFMGHPGMPSPHYPGYGKNHQFPPLYGHPGMHSHMGYHPQSAHMTGSHRLANKPTWQSPIPLDNKAIKHAYKDTVSPTNKTNPFENEVKNEEAEIDEVNKVKNDQSSREKAKLIEYAVADEEKKSKEVALVPKEIVVASGKDKNYDELMNYTRRLEDQLKIQNDAIRQTQENQRIQFEENQRQRKELEQLKQLVHSQSQIQESARMDNSDSMSVSQKSFREPPTYNPNKTPPPRVSNISSHKGPIQERTRNSRSPKRRQQDNSEARPQSPPKQQSSRHPTEQRRAPSHTVIDGRKKAPSIENLPYHPVAQGFKPHKIDINHGHHLQPNFSSISHPAIQDQQTPREPQYGGPKANDSPLRTIFNTKDMQSHHEKQYAIDHYGNKIYLDDASPESLARLRLGRQGRQGRQGPYGGWPSGGNMGFNNIQISSPSPVHYETRTFMTPSRQVAAHGYHQMRPSPLHSNQFPCPVGYIDPSPLPESVYKKVDFSRSETHQSVETVKLSTPSIYATTPPSDTKATDNHLAQAARGYHQNNSHASQSLRHMPQVSHQSAGVQSHAHTAKKSQVIDLHRHTLDYR